MFKLLKRYAKGVKWLVVLASVLLFFQAQFELALPDYMSDIVTYGIQNRGIDYTIPTVVDQKTYDQLLILGDDKQLIKQSYHYKTRDELYEEKHIKLNKQIKGAYILRKSALKTDKHLQKALGNSLVISDLLQNEPKVQKNLPKGFDIAKMPKPYLKMIVNKVDKQIDKYDDNTLRMVKSQAILKNYKSLGLDVDQIQINYILKVGSIMLIVVVTIVLLDVLASYLLVLFSTKVAARLRQALFNQIVDLSSVDLSEFSTSSLITRTTNDVQQIQGALMSSLRNLIFAPIIGIGAIIKVMNTSVDMVWIIALVVVIILSFIGVILKICTPKFAKMQSLIDRLNLVVRESLSGMLVVRAFHNEQKEKDKFSKASKDIQKTQFFTNKYMGLLVPVISFIMNSVAIVILYFGSHKIDQGSLDIGNMMAFIQYSMEIIMSFLMVAIVASLLPRATVACQRCQKVLSKTKTIDDNAHLVEPQNDLQGVLEFKNVTFKYPTEETPTLTNINFKLDPSTPTAIIGSTGCGKTTLLNLILRLYDVIDGEILFNGVNIKEWPLDKLRNKIGIVFQNASLFKGDVASNVKYGNNADDDRVIESLKNACADFVLDDPQGIHYPISQKGSNISGGQRQRLAIAKTLAKDADLYLFDDSFSALDFQTDAKVRANVERQCAQQNSSFIIVGQRISSIMKYPQIIVLDEGKIVGIGNHEQLLKTCNVYQEIAQSQLSKEELAYEANQQK